MKRGIKCIKLIKKDRSYSPNKTLLNMLEPWIITLNIYTQNKETANIVLPKKKKKNNLIKISLLKYSIHQVPLKTEERQNLLVIVISK